MSQAYQQIELDKTSRKYTVINTHRGLFVYKRLLFRISMAPAVFQCIMDNYFSITGKTEEEHLATLDIVLSRLKTAGLRLKKTKCSFMTESVQYLGHWSIQRAYTQPLNKSQPFLKHQPQRMSPN